MQFLRKLKTSNIWWYHPRHNANQRCNPTLVSEAIFYVSCCREAEKYNKAIILTRTCASRMVYPLSFNLSCNVYLNPWSKVHGSYSITWESGSVLALIKFRVTTARPSFLNAFWFHWGFYRLKNQRGSRLHFLHKWADVKLVVRIGFRHITNGWGSIVLSFLKLHVNVKCFHWDHTNISGFTSPHNTPCNIAFTMEMQGISATIWK